jgi:hypothetical protein
MEKQLATRLMGLLLELGKPLNEVAELIEQISDEDEKRIFRRGIGEMMGRMWTDLQFELVKQYPDLDPDKDTEWFRDLQARRAAREADEAAAGDGGESAIPVCRRRT